MRLTPLVVDTPDEPPLSCFPAEVGMAMSPSSGHRWSDGTCDAPLKPEPH